ncbi:MAG: hypothetical protein H5T86_04285 [Armatimonadetes bacterium]|nr:hypothetical protein [Armatimonadota bacterium]
MAAAVLTAVVGGDTTSIGLRFFVRALPLCGMFVGEWLSALQEKAQRWAKLAAAAVLCAAVGVQALMTTVHRMRWVVERARGTAGPWPIADQLVYAVEAFRNFLAGRRYLPMAEAMSAGDALAKALQFNYPNYWWAMAASAGLPKWLAMGCGAVLALCAVLCLWSAANAARSPIGEISSQRV